MAARKEAIAEPVPYNLGLGADDVALPRLRVCNKLTDLCDSEKVENPDGSGNPIARVGDIAIGMDSTDPDSMIVRKGEGLRVYVLDVHANYGTKFGGTEGGPWEEGDPEMPDDAMRQFNYRFFVPSLEQPFPVTYTASSTAAGAARNMNTQLATAGLAGTPPYEMCWEIGTVVVNGKHTYAKPTFRRVEPTTAEVAAAKAMHDALGIGVQRTQIAPSSDEPSY